LGIQEIKLAIYQLFAALDEKSRFDLLVNYGCFQQNKQYNSNLGLSIKDVRIQGGRAGA